MLASAPTACLDVHWQGEVWHADVGFGLGTLLEPLPFGAGDAHEQAGWRFRVVQDGPELVLQTVQGGEWADVYGFHDEPVPFIDVETSSWWVSTHPRSPFVSGLIRRQAGRRRQAHLAERLERAGIDRGDAGGPDGDSGDTRGGAQAPQRALWAGRLRPRRRRAGCAGRQLSRRLGGRLP